LNISLESVSEGWIIVADLHILRVKFAKGGELQGDALEDNPRPSVRPVKAIAVFGNMEIPDRRNSSSLSSSSASPRPDVVIPTTRGDIFVVDVATQCNISNLSFFRLSLCRYC
jgi:hypothetical protein